MARYVDPFTVSLGAFTPGYREKWNGNTDWCRGLTRTEKALYQQIIEQPSITRAGVLATGADVLAEQHPDTSTEEIEADLATLIEQNYVVKDGSLLWVRSWFKYDRNLLNPRYLTPILDSIRSISKAGLRHKVAEALIETLVMVAREGKSFNPTLATMAREFAQESNVSTRGLPMPGDKPAKKRSKSS